MIILDGSHGEGGGQILRTALALSLITQQPFRIRNIRAGRAKPGLMRQHLAAVDAAAAIGRADVAGAAVGSTEISFVPGRVTPGDYRFSIGTAGSTTLVLQTVLPALILADAPSTVTIEGGTHTICAPTFDFIDRVYLPLLNRMGPAVAARIERHGFFPAGGGRIVADITPAPARTLAPLHLTSRGRIVARSATAVFYQLSGTIGERELAVVRERLGFAEDETHLRTPASAGCPGNALLIEIRSEHITELFSAVGQLGKSAEAVAEEATDAARHYLAAPDTPVGPHLADQLTLTLALARSGSFTTTRPTPHTLTNTETIHAFMPEVRFSVEEHEGTARVSVDGE